VALRWSAGVVRGCHCCGQRAEGPGGDNQDSSFCPMANDLLLTAHHREAMANACDRGFWMPMALTAEQASQLTHLTAVHHGSDAISLIARISSMALWSERDGISLWLPFVDWLLPLLRPVPLGSRQLLSGWLPQRPQQLQLLNLEQLQRSSSLSDLLLDAGACCDWPGAPSLAAAAADQAA